MVIGVASTIVDDQKSQESADRQLARQDILQSQNDSLRNRIDSLIQITHQGDARLDAQNTFLQARISELNAKLEPFVKIAVTKYPTHDIESALKQLANDVEKAKELAKPPSLTPRAREISKFDGGISYKIQFEQNKNVPLGNLEFSVTLPQSSRAKILDFWPVPEAASFYSDANSKKIAPDGKSATLTYHLIGMGLPTIEIKVTEKCEALIRGNYIDRAIRILIE